MTRPPEVIDILPTWTMRLFTILLASVGCIPAARSRCLGCDNSVASGGARFITTGTIHPDTLVLHSSGELPNAATLVFQGNVSLTSPALFGDGLRCVTGNIKRMYTTNAVNGAVSVPGPGQPSLSARSAALGDPLLPGSVRSYQAWYRDPSPTFCASPAGSTWNLSNAVRIVW